MLNEASNLSIGMSEKAGVDLHHARIQTALVGTERIPGRHPMWSFAQRGACGHEACRQLSGKNFFSPRVPTLIELIAVGVDKWFGCLVRRMTGARSKPQKERLGLVRSACIIHEGDGFVGHVLGEVIALVGCFRWIDFVIVVHQIGVVLIGFATEKPVKAFEAPPKWPTPARCTHLRFV